MTAEEAKIEHARRMRYKRPALASLGWYDMMKELEEIQERCDEYRYAFETESIVCALDGDIDAEQEYRMAFSDLSGKTEQLYEQLIRAGREARGDYDWDWMPGDEVMDEDYEWNVFDDHLVALLGNRYDLVGYDSIEEDYFHLTRWDGEAAHKLSIQRISRETKKDLIENIGRCLGITLAFVDLRHQYDYLKAAFDVLLGENTSLLRLVDDINEAYEEAAKVDFRSWEAATKRLDRLIYAMPERAMVE